MDDKARGEGGGAGGDTDDVGGIASPGTVPTSLIAQLSACSIFFSFRSLNPEATLRVTAIQGFSFKITPADSLVHKRKKAS